MRVLLSIRPVHVENILSGKKIFEFRRRIFTRRDIESVLIYCTMPVGQLVAEFKISEILEDEPDRLWERTASGSGISKCYFDSYFEGRDRAYALGIGALNIFETPIEPGDLIDDFTPPQSYRYVPNERQLALF
jgi:predicted transcriptional regulator